MVPYRPKSSPPSCIMVSHLLLRGEFGQEFYIIHTGLLEAGLRGYSPSFGYIIVRSPYTPYSRAPRAQRATALASLVRIPRAGVLAATGVN